jgi:DNA repair exonuclease SbcCD nuclease subunit
MSKILLIGDVHLGLGYPNRLDHFFNVTTEYFEKFLIPLIKRNLTKDDIIVFLGDLFDNRSVVPINILNYAQTILETLSSICPVHIIIGNHDIYNKSDNEINSLKAYNYIPNVHVYETTTQIEFNSKKILLMPWIDDKESQVALLKANVGCEYLFCHSDLNGARMHLTSVGHRNMNKIDVNDFGAYQHVYSGHIHLVQRNKNFTFAGSIHEMDRNDIDNQKGIFILDTDTNSELFIPNNISPKFRKIYINKEEDIDLLDQDLTKDWIDLFISNSLIVNNRKLRRKLETVLQTGNFSTVEYIDDISIEEEVVDEVSINENLTINLDYSEYIKNYIIAQSYGTDKIKNGIVSEFENIISIYNESAKKNIN